MQSSGMTQSGWFAGSCNPVDYGMTHFGWQRRYMYEVIEAADVALTCDTQLGAQWWPLGLVQLSAGSWSKKTGLMIVGLGVTVYGTVVLA